jgi:elongation factor G
VTSWATSTVAAARSKAWRTAGAKAIKGTVPLSEMFGYVTSLRTLSSGRASSTMEFSHYEQAPNNVTEAVLAKVRGKVSA